MRCFRRCESVASVGNVGRSSRGEEGGDVDGRWGDWVNNRTFEGSEFERMPRREVKGRIGVGLIGLKVLKKRRRGIKRRIMEEMTTEK